MFLHTDPQAQLDIYHQHSAELTRRAAEYRLARLAAGGRHRRFGWWRRKDRAAHAAQVSVPA